MSKQPTDEGPAAELRRATHELNNLIAVLQGNAEALARALPPSDPARKHLDALNEALSRSELSARRISGLINGQDVSELGALLAPKDPSSRESLAGTETVLLADDEAALRSVTARFLSMNGYKVLEAGNADQARAAYDKADGAVDIVVSDVMMGASSGLELANVLRRRNPALKVLFVSGNQAPAVDPAHFLPKPFRPKDLLRRLRGILDAGASAASPG